MKILIIDGFQAIEEYLLKSGNVRIKYVTCGKSNCKCKLGYRHGPYYYIRKKIEGKYKDVYIKPPKDIPSFSYETVGSSILLDVKKIEQLPEFLKSLPIFSVHERIS